MPILQAGALYFALTFAAGWVLGPIREFWVIPRLGRTVGFVLEAPLMLVVSVLVARWVVRRFAAPPTLPTRALVGLVALGMLLVAELLGAWGSAAFLPPTTSRASAHGPVRSRPPPSCSSPQCPSFSGDDGTGDARSVADRDRPPPPCVG
jgi:hypothetical protein